MTAIGPTHAIRSPSRLVIAAVRAHRTPLISPVRSTIVGGDIGPGADDTAAVPYEVGGAFTNPRVGRLPYEILLSGVNFCRSGPDRFRRVYLGRTTQPPLLRRPRGARYRRAGRTRLPTGARSRQYTCSLRRAMSENGPREGTKDLPRSGPDAGRRAVDGGSAAGAVYQSISRRARRRRL